MPFARQVSGPARAALAVGILVLAGAAVASFRSPIRHDRQQSVALLRGALTELDDVSADPSRALADYGAALTVASSRLRRAVVHYPADCSSLARLAAVQWESGQLQGTADGGAVLGLVDLAAGRGPRDPQLQAELGSLLYKMGEWDRASRLMARSVSLSPAMANRVTAAMLEAGMSPEETANALSGSDQALVALKDSFLAEGHGAAYLSLVDGRLAEASPALVATFGEACLQVHAPERLRDALAALPPSTSVETTAERACQSAHAWFSIGNPERAVELIETALRSRPDDARLEELHGEILLAAGRGSDAETAFRRAIELGLANGSGTTARARLYDALSRCLEVEGRTDAAYDALRRSVALDPAAPGPASRLAAYEHGGALQGAPAR